MIVAITRHFTFSRDGKALERFLQDYFDGNLKKYLKSEPVPESNDGPVKVSAVSRVAAAPSRAVSTAGWHLKKPLLCCMEGEFPPLYCSCLSQRRNAAYGFDSILFSQCSNCCLSPLMMSFPSTDHQVYSCAEPCCCLRFQSVPTAAEGLRVHLLSGGGVTPTSRSSQEILPVMKALHGLASCRGPCKGVEVAACFCVGGFSLSLAELIPQPGTC